MSRRVERVRRDLNQKRALLLVRKAQLEVYMEGLRADPLRALEDLLANMTEQERRDMIAAALAGGWGPTRK